MASENDWYRDLGLDLNEANEHIRAGYIDEDNYDVFCALWDTLDSSADVPPIRLYRGLMSFKYSDLCDLGATFKSATVPDEKFPVVLVIDYAGVSKQIDIPMANADSEYGKVSYPGEILKLIRIEEKDGRTFYYCERQGLIFADQRAMKKHFAGAEHVVMPSIDQRCEMICTKILFFFAQGNAISINLTNPEQTIVLAPQKLDDPFRAWLREMIAMRRFICASNIL